MKLFDNLNLKSVIYGIIISIICIILGYKVNELFYPFVALGILYGGYCASNIKQGVAVGCIVAVPIAILTLLGYLGSFSGFFKTSIGLVITVIIILLVGAFVGFIGAWAKRDRIKALAEYENKNSKGKTKKKKKK